MKMLWIAFVLGAVLAWGAYVPVLHEGQGALGGKPSAGAMRAFLCVGIAYCITAVIAPLVLVGLGWTDEPLTFNVRGAFFATLAGAAGAAGALCIILAIKNEGNPLFIAPLVFAGAPIVNTLISLAWHPPPLRPGLAFYVGIVLAASGAGLVLYSKADLDRRGRELRTAAKPAPAQPIPQRSQSAGE
ncbi:MAG: hypothetical protein C4297_13380 [Gemmataceae bacterium]